MRRVLQSSVVIVVLALGACAHQPRARAPLTRDDLMRLAAPSEAEGFVADARLTYFGERGRWRVSGTIAAQRPASLRYEARGPHGGVVSAFTTNGLELSALDVANSHFVYGRATPKNLDRLLPFTSLGLSAAAWLRLFFGEMELPEDAAVTYDGKRDHYVARFTRAGLVQEAHIDPTTARLLRLVVSAAGEVVYDVELRDRDRHGIPTSLRIYAAPKERLEIKLSDIDTEVVLEPSTFFLDAPQGVTREHLAP